MQIAFWSNIGGKNGVTSNMAGVGIMSALLHKKKILMMENHFHINNLETAFISRDNGSLKEEELYFYNPIGMDFLIKKLHSNIETEDMIKNSALEFLNQSIYYIPQSHLNNREIFEHQLYEVICPLLDKIEQEAELTFIDTIGGNLTSKVILSKADMVVVNLSQDPGIIEHFFENYSSLISKAVFLMGNYNRNSTYNLSKIRNKYHINKDRIAIIPYNIEFKDSLSSGSLISFLTRNYNCTKDEDNYYFIRELKKAVRMITKGSQVVV